MSGHNPLLGNVNKIPVQHILKTEYGRLEAEGI